MSTAKLFPREFVPVHSPRKWSFIPSFITCLKDLLHASIVLGAGNIVMSRTDTHPGLRGLKVLSKLRKMDVNSKQNKTKTKNVFEDRTLIFNPRFFSLIVFE